MRNVRARAALALFLASSSAFATEEVAELRQALEQTRARLGELEARLAAVEARAAVAPAMPAAQAPVTVAVATSGGKSADSAFNPAISAVLQAGFNSYSRNPQPPVLPGFVLGEEAGLPNRGFSLGETELSLAANIDTLFYGAVTASLHDSNGDTGISLEEAFIETLALPYGVKIRAGRMFPVLGYLNEIHAHADSFVDRPLPYRAFLGGDNYRDDGVQLSVLLPTALYAEIGGGAFRGSQFPASDSGGHGTQAETLFARLGGDLGISSSWLAGVSYLRARAADRVTGTLRFDGTDDVYVADAKYTWAPGGNLASRFLTLQGEYFWRRERGNYDAVAYREEGAGWYLQAVYKFLPQWKVGYRFASLDPPGVPVALAGTALDSQGHDPRTHSVLLEFDHSEFSSLRFQYTRDDSGPRPDNAATVRYTVSMGAHGAHKY
jgi:hypothetical protein